MKKFTSFILFFVSLTILGQPTSWTSRGIGAGGALQNPAISPQFSNNAYVTCDMSQAFNTTNDGTSWQILNFNELTGGLYGKVCYTDNASKLYAIAASSTGGYIPKFSLNGGVNWSPITPNPCTGPALNIISNIHNNQQLFIADGTKIYFSNNAGATFSTISTYAPGMHMSGAFFDGNNIYVCTNTSILSSTNGGVSFNTLLTHSTSAITSTQTIVSFTGAKQGSTTKFFCTTISSSNFTNKTFGTDVQYYQDLYTLTLPSTTWTSIGSTLQSATTDLERAYYVVTNDNDYTNIYIGGSIATSSGTYGTVYKSTDGGTTWVNKFLNGTIAITNSNIATGWIGNSATAFYSNTWKSINTTEGICIDPNNINHIIRTDKSAIYKSFDGGNTWQQIYDDAADSNPAGTNIPYNKSYKGIGIETFVSYWLTWTKPQNLIAGCADISAIISHDGGTKWSYDYNPANIRAASSPTLKINDVSMIVKHPKTGVLYASTGDIVGSNGTWDDTRLSQSFGRLCFSIDSGATWQIMKDFQRPVTYIEFDKNRPDTMYVCVHDIMGGPIGGIYRCTNVSAGASANWGSGPLPKHPRANNRPNNIYVINKDTLMSCYYPLDSLNSAATAYAYQSGVFYSVDGGNSWQDRTNQGMKRGVMNILPDPNDPTLKTWFAFAKNTTTTTPSGLYRTTDRGQTWSNVMPNTSLYSGTFHPFSPNEMYICTEFNGLYYANATNSNSFTPNPVNSYPFRTPQRVFFNPYNVNEVWVTSFGYGLCVGTTSLATDQIENFANNEALQIYPVPTKDLLKINYKGELKLIEVFDATGKKVSSFSEQNQISVGNLPEGLYFISATNKLNQKLNGKFIISKN